MKHFLRLKYTIVFLFFGFMMNAQSENLYTPPSDNELRAQIIEAFGDSADKIIFSKPDRYDFLKKTLKERVKIYKAKNEKSFPLLSTVPLFDMFNKDIKKPINFNPKDFKIFNYSINLYNVSSQYYAIDGEDFIIVIKGQNIKRR